LLASGGSSGVNLVADGDVDFSNNFSIVVYHPARAAVALVPSTGNELIKRRVGT
jgi:hypothetical protein